MRASFIDFRRLSTEAPVISELTSIVGRFDLSAWRPKLPASTRTARKRPLKPNRNAAKKPVAKARRQTLVVPARFRAALSRNQKARATFQNFSYNHKMEYVKWVIEAKREETREKRIKTALQWLAKGKPSNGKYLNC